MFALVEDGKVVQEFGSVPDSLNNVSGFNLLSTEEQSTHGFYPIEEVKPVIKDSEKLIVKSEEVAGGLLVRTYGKVKKSPEELSSDLLTAQAQAIHQLTQKYSETINSNITYKDAEFKADYESRKTVAECVTSSGGSVPNNFGWFSINNVKIPMTFKELQGLANAIFLRGQESFENLQVKKAQVRSSKVVSEVNRVSW